MLWSRKEILHHWISHLRSYSWGTIDGPDFFGAVQVAERLTFTTRCEATEVRRGLFVKSSRIKALTYSNSTILYIYIFMYNFNNIDLIYVFEYVYNLYMYMKRLQHSAFAAMEQASSWQHNRKWSPVVIQSPWKI